MTNEEMLKPCPFCGSIPQIWYAPEGAEQPIYGVACIRCHMYVKWSDLPEFKGRITIGDIQMAVANRWKRRVRGITDGTERVD